MKIITAIASTTHIDRHHEKMAQTALDGMSEQIAAKYIPFLIEHDPNRAIGVILAGKVLPMDDGEWALDWRLANTHLSKRSFPAALSCYFQAKTN